MSLHHHAVELFLKYALARADEDVPAHHHIRDLLWRYSTTYGDAAFKFEAPFVTVYLGATTEQIQKCLTAECNPKNRNKTDQEMRYHTDRDGNVWPGAQGVMPEDYADVILQLRDQIHVLHDLIEKRMTNQTSHATSEPALGASSSAHED